MECHVFLPQYKLQQSAMLDLSYHHADQILSSPQGHPLFVGDATAAEDVHWLKGQNIRTVLSVANGFNFAYDPSIKQIKYNLEDKKSENASVYFDMAAFQIDKYLKTGGVLVHCGAGVSRSPTLVIAYLIKFKGMGFLQALKLIKSKRSQVCPNLGFELQLKAYQKIHHQNSNIFSKIPKKVAKKQLPDIVKFNPLSTFNKSFHHPVEGIKGRMTLSKSLKPEERKEKKEIEYLRKMAEFRFGITNMSRWNMLLAPNESQKKPLHL